MVDRSITQIITDMKQVNITTTVDGEVTPWISDWSADGYKGELVDTQYLDGADITDWCVFCGTQEECEDYIANLKK